MDPYDELNVAEEAMEDSYTPYEKATTKAVLACGRILLLVLEQVREGNERILHLSAEVERLGRRK